MRIIFRADGNEQIGLGHVVRSLALATMVQAVATCFFAVRNPSAAVQALLQQAGFSFVALSELPWLAEAQHVAGTLIEAGDIVVLDGYQFDFPYQQIIKSTGCRLVCVDDLYATPFAADLIINHSPGVTANQYRAQPDTRYCLGPAFSLLRQPFRQHAQLPTAVSLPITSVLLCFGGADPQHLTLRLLTALRAMPTIQRISVILGSAFGAEHTLTDMLAQEPAGRIQLQRNISAETLATLLLDYQVIICPASTVLIESLVLGRAAITGYYVENQRHLADYVHTHQQAFSMGNLTQLNDAKLAAALVNGLRFHETSLRLPYTTTLAHKQLQTEFSQLAGV